MVLRGVEGIAVCGLDEGDIVRNEVVARIVHAYSRSENALMRANNPPTRKPRAPRDDANQQKNP
jgi:phosphate starvation-inducible protein PhoH